MLMTRVLIADADDEAQAALTTILRSADPAIEIEVAQDGRSLMHLVRSQDFDCIFLDVILPYMDAEALVNWHRSATERKTALILTSDVLSPQWPTIASQIGAYDVLLKPFQEKAVLRSFSACRETLPLRRALLVEPSDKLRSLVRKVLSQSHFNLSIVETESGQQAMRYIRTQKFDLALVDNNLSDISGLEVACQLLARPDHETKVIMMTREASAAIDKTMHALGIAGYVAKPFSAPTLDKAIHKALGLWHPYLINALNPTSTSRNKVA